MDNRVLQIVLANQDTNEIFSEWREPLNASDLEDASFGDIYRAVQPEYGRCTSKIYIDRLNDKPPLHVGWFFVKRDRYEDTGEPYLRGAWVTIEKGACAHINQRVNDRSQFVCDDCGEELGR